MEDKRGQDETLFSPLKITLRLQLVNKKDPSKKLELNLSGVVQSEALENYGISSLSGDLFMVEWTVNENVSNVRAHLNAEELNETELN